MVWGYKVWDRNVSIVMSGLGVSRLSGLLYLAANRSRSQISYLYLIQPKSL